MTGTNSGERPEQFINSLRSVIDPYAVPGGASCVGADHILVPIIAERGKSQSVGILRDSPSHVIIAFGRLFRRHTTLVGPRTGHS